MAVKKFHEKNQVLFVKRQAVEGTAEAAGTFTAAEALAALSMDGSTTIETGSYTYIGDSLSRDEVSYEKDRYADFTVETPQQVLGTLVGGASADAVPSAALSLLYQASGGNVAVFSSAKGSFAAGTVFIDNSVTSDDLLTINHRKVSADDATNDKSQLYYDVRAMCDVSANTGDVPKLKFSLKGNSAAPAAVAHLAAAFGNQTSSVCSAILPSTIVSALIASRENVTGTITPAVSTITFSGTFATITWASAHSLGANGSIRAIAVDGATGADAGFYNGTQMCTIISTTTAMYVMSGTPAGNATGTLTTTSGAAPATFCFSTLQAPNFFGFGYARYMTGCATGFSKTAVPTDITVSLLEDQAGGDSFDPDANLQSFFGIKIKFGTGAGKYVSYQWDKAQLTNVKPGKVGSFLGRDTTFRNTGKSFTILE